MKGILANIFLIGIQPLCERIISEIEQGKSGNPGGNFILRLISVGFGRFYGPFQW